MSNAIEFINVSKKFRKGEKHDSLRDFIPSLFRKAFKANTVRADVVTACASPVENLNPNEFWALKDVSFELKKGEALGIIGPNGAGKSTILKMLSGILKPTKGEIKINGKLSALLEVGAGFHPDLTGRENIYLSGAIIGMKKKEIDKKIESIIEFSELVDFIDTPVKRYSSGMYVRLGFAISAHINPEILLIDEVLAVGDFSFQKKCLQKIQELKDRKTTIIFISHNLEFVRRLCPKTIFLKRGEITSYDDTQKSIESYLKSVDDTLTDLNENQNITLNEKDKTEAKIKKIRLYDISGKEKDEFKTGDFVKIQIAYYAKEKINTPAFALGFFSNGELFADHNSRFEGHEIPFIAGEGKIDLVIDNLLLLPGFYEARAYIADRDSIGIYDSKGIGFFVKENKRGFGRYYQPHSWSNA